MKNLNIYAMTLRNAQKSMAIDAVIGHNRITREDMEEAANQQEKLNQEWAAQNDYDENYANK